MWKYLLAWFPFILVAILNGLFREKVLNTYLGKLRAHQVSSLFFIVLFGIYVRFLLYLWPLDSVEEALKIGLIWLLFTIIFEFLFGHYIAGHSWDKLFEDYNLMKGRVWIVVLIWITLAPYIIYNLINTMSTT